MVKISGTESSFHRPPQILSASLGFSWPCGTSRTNCWSPVVANSPVWSATVKIPDPIVPIGPHKCHSLPSPPQDSGLGHYHLSLTLQAVLARFEHQTLVDFQVGFAPRFSLSLEPSIYAVFWVNFRGYLQRPHLYCFSICFDHRIWLSHWITNALSWLATAITAIIEDYCSVTDVVSPLFQLLSNPQSTKAPSSTFP